MSQQPTQPSPGQFPVVIMVPQNYGQRFPWSRPSPSQPPGLPSQSSRWGIIRVCYLPGRVWKPPGPFTEVMGLLTSYDQRDRLSSGYWINNYFCNIVKTSRANYSHCHGWSTLNTAPGWRTFLNLPVAEPPLSTVVMWRWQKLSCQF